MFSSNILYRFFYKKILFLCLILFSFCNVCGAYNVVYRGEVPDWLDTEQNSLVSNMRQIASAGLTAYYPHVDSYVQPGQTTCCYSVSVALRGTPYGASAENGLDFSKPIAGDITWVPTLVKIAKENGEWMDPANYSPGAGDLIIVDDGNPKDPEPFDHVMMVTESGGFIYGGGTSDPAQIKETDCPAIRAQDWDGRPVVGFIQTSKYSDGIGLTGAIGPTGLPSNGGGSGSGGSGSNKKSNALSMVVNWGLDALSTLGDSLNKLVEQFSILADEALQTMSSLGTVIIFSLIIIDFATYFIMNGFEVFLPVLLSKLTKYTFLLFVFVNWTWIVNNVFLNFAETVSSAFTGGNTSQYLTQPQFLLVKGIEVVSPALNFISSAPEFTKMGFDELTHVPFFVFLIVLTGLTMFFLFFSAMYLAYVFIEFYLMAAFNAVFMIFPVCRFTKFIAEGGIGGLVQSMIKLFTAACMVYIIAGLTNDATYVVKFPGSVKMLNMDVLVRYMFVCLHIFVLTALVVMVPHKIATMYSGKVRFPS